MASENLAQCTHHPKWNPMGRIVIEGLYPELDSGRYPVKRLVGDKVEIWADIFCDGHDALGAAVKYRHETETAWRRAPMRFFDNDRWVGLFELTQTGRYIFTIEAWVDLFESWRQNFRKKKEAGQDTSLELREGYEILEMTLRDAPGTVTERLRADLDRIGSNPSQGEREELLQSEKIHALMADHGARANVTLYAHENAITADRRAAGYAAWYEMFARSQGTVPDKSATFDDCIRRLPEIEEMGFDVLYFVPIHPIGRVNRKGRNNTLEVTADDPGSPYAIGSEEGGHTAVHPELGTLDDFRRLIEACHTHGMEVALDYAIQCAPDHPWIREQASWFKFRPDGSIRYAENPPKKYQDIVNVDFYNPDREGLWTALRDVVLFWADQGVRIFRVDNPHTKPVPFWEWLIREVQCQYPDAIFLSEAFTRPKMLKILAKVGFSQSYSYFTWRNFKQELIDYLTELTQSECREFLRPNFFTNTPDILPPILQRGGRPAFQMRLVLAATLSSVYGIYNGFELCENDAIPDTEEYRNSEKYEYKIWDWDRPGNIKDYVARVNKARRDNPALQEFLNLRFYPASSDSVLFYGKMTADGSNIVFVAVNLDPFETHESSLQFPLDEMKIGPDDAFEVEDLLTGERHLWNGGEQHIRLDPQNNPAAIFRITPFRHVTYRPPQV